MKKIGLFNIVVKMCTFSIDFFQKIPEFWIYIELITFKILMMKNLIRMGLIVSFSFFIAQSIAAQGLLKGIKNKAQDKIEQRIEQRANDEVDKQIDKQLDKAEEALFPEDKNNDSSMVSNRKKNDDERLMSMMKRMGVGGEPVPIADSYNFNNLVEMHIESFDGSGKKISEGEFITHLSSNSKSMAYEFVSGDMAEPGMGMIIVDAENNATIILSEEKGQKTALVTGLGTVFESLAEEDLEELDYTETPETYLANPNVEKTGRSKTIAGFKCDEYKYTDESNVSNIWITQDIKMNTRDFFSTLFKTSLYTHGMAWGYMMEATTVNKENGEKSYMTVTRVDKNANRKVVMGEYQVTNLGSFAPTEEK